MRAAPPVAAAERVARVPRSGIRAVLEHAGRADAIDLASGDPSFPTPTHVVEAAAAATAAGRTHYTHGRGDLALRIAIAARLEHDYGLTVDPETELVVTAGALNALAATFQALLDPADEVLVPDPGFANYRAQVALAGGVAVPVPLADDWSLDADAVAARIGPRTRAIVVNSPSNPTGAVAAEPALTRLLEVLEPSPAVVVSDEAYEHLVYPPHRHVAVAAVPGFRERTISIYSFSKTYAMTGWRLGYAAAPAALAEAIAKVQEHLIGCPSSVAQAAGQAALAGPWEPVETMLAAYARRRDAVVAAFAGVPGVSLVAPQGAFYAFPRIGSTGSEPAAALAAATGVLTVPGDAFGSSGAGHVRVSFAGADDALAAGLARIRAYLTEAQE